MSRYGRGAPTTLYVRNVSTRCRYDDLKSFFQNYGKIIDVTIPLDYYSGMPKGFCFVEFDDPRDAEEAQYRLDRKYFFGREIDVEFARGTRQTASDMRTRDRRFDQRRSNSRDRNSRDRYSRDRNSRGRSSRGRYEDDRRSRSPRSRTRSRSRDERRETNRSKRKVERSPSRERSYSKSRSRSVSKNRTPSPHRRQARSVSRDSRDQRSASREMA